MEFAGKPVCLELMEIITSEDVLPVLTIAINAIKMEIVFLVVGQLIFDNSSPKLRDACLFQAISITMLE